VYTLLSLTHVCQFWRASLIRCPQAWTTIFATHKERRSFVEMCLARSQPLPLEVTVDTSHTGQVSAECSCNEDGLGVVLPNGMIPCEWHFVFEPLAHLKNSKRIQVLNTNSSVAMGSKLFEFGRCRFFSSPLPQLTRLTWKDDGTMDSHSLFHDPFYLPNLSSMIFEGRWHRSLSRVHNLSSFTIRNLTWRVDAEAFRLFISNNRSLESLEIAIELQGGTEGPAIDLLNLKSLTVNCRPMALLNIIRVPAFERLSSLRVSLEDELGDLHTLRATGDGISLSAKSWAYYVAEDWQYLTEYARPTIHHVRFYDKQPTDFPPYGFSPMVITTLMADAQTVEMGMSYSGCKSNTLWAELKQLGPQLKVIRFEISEELDPLGGSNDLSPFLDDKVLERIADLVEYRLKEGRPFSTVERMVGSEDEWVDLQQDRVWRSFYEDRRIGEYLASAQRL